ncbi:DNA-binding transcriptional regulator, AcrR family [Mycolicibacterium rutilum]|uniref:DNA-binding transcriptional regulator, AcrR family n=1 Tax=Mycolicibacterium rutilum TaxID=370526 RepID=A0A1H6LLN7_MYCRU|nr:TetR/AcrR family transcriptional regulator [Mycolicibacterium rutilum]SEH87026.1 DNA-binding transcriptional regulator, AcrR family [Mycolicibacterium rutilum]
MATRGRPRAFDRAEALRRAMEVFWEHGYEATSISHLTAAMGINSPSLYGAFGSKETLFREAVAHYDATEGAAVAAALRDLPTAREAIAESLRHNAIAFTEPGLPPGCMIVLSACTDRSQTVHNHLSGLRLELEKDFAERIERGIADGDVPAGADAATIAAFYNTVNHGMAIQARDGADRAKLSAIAESAIAAWDALVST